MSPEIASKKDSERNGRNDTRRSFKCSCASILIVLVMICSAVAVIGFSDSSDATGGNEGGITWELSGDTITFTKREGRDGVMNDYYCDYDRAPWADCGATRVVIEEGVKQIGTYAFSRMSIESISLPNSLDRIRNSAFMECSHLTSITIPDDVVLESELFDRCSSLSSVLFKGSIKFDDQAQETFGHTPSLHAVYHNKDVDLHLNKWPNQDIVFIDANGGTLTAGPTVEKNDPKFPAATYVTHATKTFQAYKVGDTYYSVGDYMPKGKVKANIEWDPIGDYDVIILFFANGHGTAPVHQSFNRGGTVTSTSPTDVETGYTFSGWCASPDMTEPWNYATPVYRNLVLYAKYDGVATVTFNTSGHSTPPNPVSVPLGNPIEKPADPSAEGYKFNGWYKDMTCQTKWNFDDPVTGDMTLYAEWDVQQYRVTFDMMGHGLGPNSQMVNYGDQVAEPAAISIEGYTFEGWFKDISFENKWDFDADFVKSDTTLYAKYVSNTPPSPPSSSSTDTVPMWVIPLVIIGTIVAVGAGIALFRH